MGRKSNGWRKAARSAAFDYPQLRRQLPYTQQRRLDAVEYALNVSSTLSSGPSRVRLIELVYFQPYNRRFLVQGAAMQIPVSVDLAWRWNSDFLHLVWSKLK